jgi:hypothetical protein
MSSSSSAATSQPRSPSRASSISTAKSRRPVTVPRSHAASKLATIAGSSARGSELSFQPAADGTAWASGAGTRPSTYRYRSSDRSPVTMTFAEAALRPRVACTTKEATWPAARPARPASGSSPASADKNARAVPR